MSKRKEAEDSTSQERPLRRLVPAPMRTTQIPYNNLVTHASVAQESRQSKRTRTIRIACDQCRTSKVACSRTRPECDRCRQNELRCQYMSDNEDDTHSKALKRIIEQLRHDNEQKHQFIERLQSVPEPEAAAMFRHLRSSGDIAAVLSSLNNHASLTPRLSEVKTARAVLPRTDTRIEFELRILHQSVYAAFEPLWTQSVNIESKFASRLQAAARTSRHIGTRTAANTVGRKDAAVYTSSPLPIRGQHVRNDHAAYGPAAPFQLCDPRLSQLDMTYWTTVPSSNEFSASILSWYLVNYHCIFGCFDADLFLNDLVECKLDFCSPFLVSSLMSYACQAYSAIDPRSSILSVAFMEEAERLWRTEQSSQTPTSLAARLCLSQASGICGKDQLSLALVHEARAIGLKLRLYDVEDPASWESTILKLASDKARELCHLAWGTYAWLSYHAYFYMETPIRYPPRLPVPGNFNLSGSDRDFERWLAHSTFSGQNFFAFCELCVIQQKIISLYFAETCSPSVPVVAMAVAESLYQELLTWSDKLSTEMHRREDNPSHVLFFHAVYHSIVFTLFRPFRNRNSRLHSFSSQDSTPDNIFLASLNQLKRILFDHLTQVPVQPVCFWINAATMHISHAIMQELTDWQFCFRMCMQFWKEAYVCSRAMLQLVEASLSLAMQQDLITGQEAKTMADGVRQLGRHHDTPEAAIASAVLDFNLAMSDPDRARMNVIASRFEELVMFDEIVES